jgi:putative Holliday junction resolvase
MPADFPQFGRLAGIDYGTVRIGIAICDPERSFASPLSTYTRTQPQSDVQFFLQLVSEYQIVGFVVGLPVFASGAESPKSREARRFGEWLCHATGIPVRFFDERYTSVEADEILGRHEMRGKRRKQSVDKLAAQILLTAYLEAPQTAGQPPPALDGTPPASD